MDTTMLTQTARQYEAARANVFGQLTALIELVTEDFPAVVEPDDVARYQVDALIDLGARLAALVWGYERCMG